jgi:hypothetical protein
MNQLGPIFRQARSESGKSLEDAVRETKIAKKYLLALENEDFSAFPGETYLIGFLRNYAQFLGLDPEDMVHKYRDQKIQEQPAPIEQLTARPKGTRRFLILLLIALIVVSTAVYLIFSGKRDRQYAEKETDEQSMQKEQEQEKSKKEVFLFDEEEVIRDFQEEDLIEIAWGNKAYRISIDGIKDNLEFSIGDIPFSLSTEERVEIDFNRDGRKDLLMRVNRLRGGVVNITLKKLFRIDRSLDEAVASERGVEEAQQGDLTPEVVIIREDEELTGIPVAPDSGFEIVSSYEMSEITSTAEALSTSYLAYIPDQGAKQESLLKTGETMSVTAESELKVMAANAKGLQLKVNEVSVNLGKEGAVIAKVIRWYRDPDNSDVFHLIMDDWKQ